ncbi:DNA-directed DNA polymerase [Corynebacterium hindlerae]|uniref:DNA-directed DNA polymerase n=1 Tax=Corynebacterium hindlerae TaxID=699041 RepID=UPI003AAF91C6
MSVKKNPGAGNTGETDSVAIDPTFSEAENQGFSDDETRQNRSFRAYGKESKTSKIDLTCTPDTPKTAGQAATAAVVYGERPIDTAAAVGWRVEVVTDPATSRKYPAQFAVLTKTVERSSRSTAGNFRSYPSVSAMASGKESVVIGFDTEFVNVVRHDPELGWVGEDVESARKIVSYQFATVDPVDPTLLRLAVVIPLSYDGPRGTRVARLSLEKALNLVITAFELHTHPLARGWKSQGVSRAEVVDSSGKKHPSWWFKKRKGVRASALPITLVAHYQHADLTSFIDHRKLLNTWETAYPGRSKYVATKKPGVDGRRARWLEGGLPDIMRAVISASGGLVSPKPVHLVLDGENRRWARPVALSIRDTMSHSGARPLAVLGDSVGVPKLKVPGNWIERMDDYWQQFPIDFLAYSINDAIIALEYCNAVYGDNADLPLTLPTGAARAVRRIISDELGGGAAKFNAVFGGLVEVDKDQDIPDPGIENHLDYYRKRELQPLDGAAATWLHACANSFRGGYNMAAELGIFPFPTYDFDLQSCYPTSASCVLDVDYLHEDGVITRTVNNYQLSLSDFDEWGPLTPFVGFVSFSFPESVAFPTIPVPVEGSMVFTRSSGDGRGVWASAPEIWAALMLGAVVTCQIGHFGRVLVKEDGTPSRLLRKAFKQLIDDRARAKSEFGPKSFEQDIIKLMANSPYGKLAQGVMGQSGWDSWAQEREAVGGSAITSPYHACYTTGIVRAVLLLTLNDLHDAGYRTPSCTTDGFITDAPFDVVDALDQLGLGDIWREAREALTGSCDMWEQKHQQSDLYNVTTRANFSRQSGGVLAHGGFKLPPHIVEDSQEDRDFMYDMLVTRDSALPMSMTVFPSLHELSRIENRLDFAPKRVHKELTIEFDRKRRPIPDGMTADFVIIGGQKFEVAHVRTVPWDTPEDCRLGRSIDKGLKRFDKDSGQSVWTRSPVRRTREQWLDYFERLDRLLDEDGRIAEQERLERISKGIVIAQRQGVIEIPWLAPGRSLAERLDAFECFGLPRPRERFWHHARSKTERQVEVELNEIEPFVQEMMLIDPFEDVDEEGVA